MIFQLILERERSHFNLSIVVSTINTAFLTFAAIVVITVAADSQNYAIGAALGSTLANRLESQDTENFQTNYLAANAPKSRGSADVQQAIKSAHSKMSFLKRNTDNPVLEVHMVPIHCLQ